MQAPMLWRCSTAGISTLLPRHPPSAAWSTGQLQLLRSMRMVGPLMGLQACPTTTPRTPCIHKAAMGEAGGQDVGRDSLEPRSMAGKCLQMRPRTITRSARTGRHQKQWAPVKRRVAQGGIWLAVWTPHKQVEPCTLCKGNPLLPRMCRLRCLQWCLSRGACISKHRASISTPTPRASCLWVINRTLNKLLLGATVPSHRKFKHVPQVW